MNAKTKNQLKEKILDLKKEKNAIILAHYYQLPEIQEIADFVGDSLALSQKAKSTNADIIVFAGVHFMAETAKILNPQKKVILPDLNASCSLAESCDKEEFKKLLKKHPDFTVVSYINCSAEIKALSDITCTSSNAEKIIRSIPKNKPVLFAPDKNLGNYLIKKTKRKMHLWDGLCIVHQAFAMDKILLLHRKHPNAKFIAHPESSEEILQIAVYIGSTAGMLDYVKKSDAKEFIVATEAGLLHQMKKEVPDKILIPAPVEDDNSCACSECAYMKLNTLEKLYKCLKEEKPEILISENLRKKAEKPIARMLELSC
ncbi:MAG: quinolinate synthase NadA [Cytophagales bacterium]